MFASYVRVCKTVVLGGSVLVKVVVCGVGVGRAVWCGVVLCIVLCGVVWCGMLYCGVVY